MPARIEVVGLGPHGPELMTAGTLAVWRSASRRFLRTARHPAAESLIADEPSAATVGSFDHLYESLETFEAVYHTIVEELLAEAAEHGHVVYAVPGAPTVAEYTVELLQLAAQDPGGPEVVVHPALSFADLAWARLGVDPVEVRAHLVDGHAFDPGSIGGGAALVAQCESTLTLSEIKLSLDEPPPAPVTILQRLGGPYERIVEVDWADIDRTVEPDHLTSLWIPELPRTAGGRLEDMAVLLDRLRAEDPWKRSQTHDTLRRYLLEESYEVLEALDHYDPGTGQGAEELAGELGDLLYQVVFHSALAAEAGWFDLADVVGAIHDKLVARHPHLEAVAAPTIEELTADWEQVKRAEHGRSSAFDGIPPSLPALVRTMAIAKKASALGLEIGRLSDGTGGALLGIALAAVEAGEDPEDALRRELLRVEGNLRASGQ